MNTSEENLDIPENIEVKEEENLLTITYKPTSFLILMGVIMLCISLLGLSLIANEYSFYKLTEKTPDLFLIVGPFLLFIISLYFILLFVLKKTISVTKENMRAEIYPLFTRNILVNNIKEVSVKPLKSFPGSLTYYYSINLIDRNNKEIQLINPLLTYLLS